MCHAFKPLMFAQVAGDQLVLEQTFGLEFGYPAVVAVSGSKRRFAVQRDSFGHANTAKFVKDILSGKHSTGAAEKWPALKAVTVRDNLLQCHLISFVFSFVDRSDFFCRLGTEKTLLFLHLNRTSISRPTCDTFILVMLLFLD